MQKIVLAAAVLAALGAPVAADQERDRSIDEAAARIVADKIGHIRGGFPPGEEPVFVDPEAAVQTGAVRQTARGWDRGLARAREPLAMVSAGF